jgi:hypothetical protein
MPALAGPIADKAAEIEAMIAADDMTAAAAAADALYGQIWDATTSIGFRNVVLVSEPAGGYGIYNPRTDEKYKLGEPIVIYAEPYGFGYGTPSEGLNSMAFIVDLKVITEGGEVLGEIPNLTEIVLESRYKNREFQANLTYNLDGISAGRYVLQTTLRDKNSDKSGTFENTIEITEQVYDAPIISTSQTTITTERTVTGSTSNIETTIESND